MAVTDAGPNGRPTYPEGTELSLAVWTTESIRSQAWANAARAEAERRQRRRLYVSLAIWIVVLACALAAATYFTIRAVGG